MAEVVAAIGFIYSAVAGAVGTAATAVGATAAVGAGAVGASTAVAAGVGALAAAAFEGAVIGALAGGIKASMSGGDILEGALQGAGTGAIAGGALKGVQLAGEAAGILSSGGTNAVANASQPAGETTTGYSGQAASDAFAAPNPTVGPINPNAGAEALNKAVTAPSVQDMAAGATRTAAGVAQPGAQATGGAVDTMANWANQNPLMASTLTSTVGGAAQGLMTNRAKDKELEQLKEFEQMKIDAGLVKPRGGILNIPTPKFNLPPSWKPGYNRG